MKEFVPAFFLIICGVSGLILVHSKEAGGMRPGADLAAGHAVITVRAVQEQEAVAEGDLKILDENNIRISKDSTLRNLY